MHSRFQIDELIFLSFLADQSHYLFQDFRHIYDKRKSQASEEVSQGLGEVGMVRTMIRAILPKR
jgi:hypothetical protein